MQTHILILRPGAIGDALLTFPIMQALRTRYNQGHITFVSNPAVIPLAHTFGLADEVSDYSSSQWSDLFSSSSIRHPVLHDLLHHTTDAICWLRDPDGVVEQNLRTAGIQNVTIAPGRPMEGSQIHVVEYLAETIGMHIDSATVIAGAGRPQGPAPTILCRQWRQDVYSRGRPLWSPWWGSPHPTASQSHYIAIHPGSGSANKCWPVPRFAAIITELWHRQVPVLLLTGPDDAERLSDLLHQIASPPDPSLLTLLVNAPLLEVAEQLQHCRGYLGNDSGITHLAAQLGIPTIALFGPSDPATWQPVGPSVYVLHETVINTLQVDVVMNVIIARFMASL